MELGGAQADPAPRSSAELVEEGRALHRAGRLEDAERRYREALSSDEECAEAHQLLAVIAGQRGQFEKAIAGFRRAIALEGPTPDRLYNLAEALRVTGEIRLALDAYGQTLALDAAYLDAYRNCAAMLTEAAQRARVGGDPATAEQFDKLAAHYLLGLGHARLRAHEIALAEQTYREATVRDPSQPEAYNCLGVIALEAHRPVEAEGLFLRAHDLEPASPLYLNNLARAVRSQLRLAEAAELFRKAIAADSSFEEAKLNLEERMLPWLGFRTEPGPQAVFAAHRDWGRSAAALASREVGLAPAFANRRDPERRLRIAYVGLDTSSRLMQSFLEPLISNHNARAVETVIYVSVGMPDEHLRRFKELAGIFRQVGRVATKNLTQLVREDGIDIAVDLAGHMDHHRLDVFARRPAPISVTWLGYPGTTGLPTIDYRITDDVADPPGAEEYHTERLYRIKSGSVVYRSPKEAGPVAPPPARAPGVVAFGYFDDPRKISPEVIQAWNSILRQLPEARLLLMAPEFTDREYAARLSSEFEPAENVRARVELRRAPETADATLSAYADVDIGLDTFPYNGALTTICEALWMGVPMITLSGDRSCARTSASILAQLGLERLDSETAEEYADTAVELAQDLGRLRQLRAGMRDRMRVSPLMDERDFARRLEAALRDMWRQWCKTGT